MSKYDKLDEYDYSDYYRLIDENPWYFRREILRLRWQENDRKENILGDTWDASYKLIQFWDSKLIPADVHKLFEMWRDIVPEGCHELYDDESARRFIIRNYGEKAALIYDYCYHPAMKSDIFRLAYLYLNGGVYVDADIKPLSREFPKINFTNKQFLILPVLTREVQRNERDEWVWLRADNISAAPSARTGPVVYFNNEFVITSRRHPAIGAALVRALDSVESVRAQGKTDASPHLLTGPTCVSNAVCATALRCAFKGDVVGDIFFMERGIIFKNFVAVTVKCDYKSDARHWINVHE